MTFHSGPCRPTGSESPILVIRNERRYSLLRATYGESIVSNNTIMAIALVPVALYLLVMATFLALQPFELPTGLLPGGAIVVTILSIGFANILRIRRDQN